MLYSANDTTEDCVHGGEGEKKKHFRKYERS